MNCLKVWRSFPPLSWTPHFHPLSKCKFLSGSIRMGLSWRLFYYPPFCHPSFLFTPWGVFVSQAPSSCGCSGPASTRPSRRTATTSTALLWTPTTPWPPARYPHSQCPHWWTVVASLTWWGIRVRVVGGSGRWTLTYKTSWQQTFKQSFCSMRESGNFQIRRLLRAQPD